MAATMDANNEPALKKRRYAPQLADIPTSAHYQVSLMHREIVTHAVCSNKHGYVVTASSDGVVKFWKRLSIDDGGGDENESSNPNTTNTSKCLEFVKSFTAHVGAITSLSISPTGDTVVSVGLDNIIKVYDVSTFDVTGMIKVAPVLSNPAIILPEDMVGVAEKGTGKILVYSLATLSPDPIKTIQLHAAPITAMTYNDKYQCVMSTDRKGIIELWKASASSLGSSVVDGVTYSSKMETDLYDLAKKKTCCIALATNGTHYLVYGKDHKVRIISHTTGKTVVRYDERSKVYDKTFGQYQMDTLDYGKRAATEREINSESDVFGQENVVNPLYQSLNVAFDPTGTMILIPTLAGIKVIEWSTNKVLKVVAKGDASALRFVNFCLCSGDAKVNRQMQLARSGGSKTAMDHDRERLSDALIVAVAYKKRRLYCFSQKDPLLDSQEDGNENIEDRDVLNEPPDAEDRLLTSGQGPNVESHLASVAILRTSMGDIHLKLFPQEVPRTIENFCRHAKDGYYDGVIFHRVIKGFMLQTGDPLGDGTGGESIWGGEFEDEIVRELRHDRPFTVSMANAGPNTNGSQFFITTVPTPWLDGKHTVFGRITSGMDVCTAIEKAETDHNDKPTKEINIMSIDVE